MVKSYLDFEQPIADIESKILELENSDLDQNQINKEVIDLNESAVKLTEKIYSNLSPWQNVQVARHPERPHFVDYIERITDEFDELHGDRHFSDDRAILGGIGKIGEHKVVIVGHEKGRSTEEKIKHNFGMSQPEGYRKACRLMKLAERFSLPIVTLIDTPGAYPGIDSEERGQSEAIAYNLKVMSSLKTPIIVNIVGEGGSGGALALGVGDHINMMEHATYSVASPEACASIVWRDSGRGSMPPADRRRSRRSRQMPSIGTPTTLWHPTSCRGCRRGPCVAPDAPIGGRHTRGWPGSPPGVMQVRLVPVYTTPSRRSSLSAHP